MLALAACAALLAGCDTSHRESNRTPLSTPSIGPLPTVTAGALWALPLAAYTASPAEQAIIGKAEGVLIRRCMRQLGFTAWQPPPPAGLSTDWHTGLRIGIVDAEQARRYGYHAPGSGAVRRRSETSDPRRRAELAALSGDRAVARELLGKEIPEGGCSGEPDRALHNGKPAYDDLYARLSEQADEATRQDRRVVEAIGAWRACMKQAGYSYRNPWEASEQTWAVDPTSAEKALATADVACKRRTDLPGIWFAVLSGYQRQLIERNRPGVQSVRAAVEVRLRKAHAVLASDG